MNPDVKRGAVIVNSSLGDAIRKLKIKNRALDYKENKNVRGEQCDTVYLRDRNIRPYTYENCVEKLQAAIDECKRSGARVLSLPKGRYDIWPEGAVRKEYFISNTSSEQECPSKVKTIGLWFNDIDGLTIEGNGSTLMYHGKMTTMVFDHCRNIRLHDIHIDFERPAGSEMQYVKEDSKGVEVRIHRNTRYEIVDGRLNLYGEGWRSNKNHCIEYDSEAETFRHSKGWSILSDSKAEEVADHLVRFAVPEDFHPRIGNTLTIRDIIRDQVGMLIVNSKDIVLSGVNMHYMHGLGIVSQYSENITMDRVKCVPPESSGRLLAASADMMHFSGCKGKVIVDSCYFAGSQDDPINIHGTNLRIVEKVDGRTLKLRFMHAQTYGFQAYSPNDEITYIRASTMERFASAKVVSVKKVSDRETEIKLDREIPADIAVNQDCIENMTCTPEVEIRNSYFTRTSTRGTLVTTPRKVLIENNVYYKTGMSAILIAGDAISWFESGPVCDVLIKGNIFVDCTYNGGNRNAVIAINPSNSVVDANHPVHKNIRIENNLFNTFGNPVLYAKSTQGVLFLNNRIERTYTLAPLSSDQSAFYLNGCKDVTIRGTIFGSEDTGRKVHIENMEKDYLKSDNIVY